MVADTEDEARIVLAEIQHRQARGEYGILDNEMMFDDIAAGFMDWYEMQVKPSTFRRAKTLLKNLEHVFTERMVSTLSLRDAQDHCRRRLAQGTTRRTCNMELLLLKQILDYGARSKLIACNPLADAKPLPDKDEKERRILEPEEIDKIIQHATEPMRPFFLLLARTGMRKSEASGLLWSEVDLNSGKIRLSGTRTKNGRSREIPLSDALRLELLRLRLTNRQSKCVFVTAHGTQRKHNVYRQLQGTAKRAGVSTDGLMLHSFRHSFATHAARAGVNPKTLQMILGHADVGTTLKYYVKMNFADMKEAVDRLMEWGEERLTNASHNGEEPSQEAVG
ncbi:MAG: site-specific integrase [Planctomycetes bacterium]|nr:site-specific integrase [Planctomycetota bacterium]